MAGTVCRPPLTEQDGRARFVESAHEAPSLPRVSLVGILPQLQAVPQHHVQDEDQNLTTAAAAAVKRKEGIGRREWGWGWGMLYFVCSVLAGTRGVCF